MCSTDEEAKVRWNEYNAKLHDLTQFGGGGFTLEYLRSLPIYLREFHYTRLVENKKLLNKPEPKKGTITEEDINKGPLDGLLKKFKIPDDTLKFKAPPPDVER